jgi:signal transduction histidine kinase
MRTVVGFMRQVLSSLRFRLLVLVVVACAPLVALMLHTAWEDRRRALAGWRQRAHSMMEINQREEQEVFGGTRQLLLAMAESSSVRSLDPGRCKKWLEEMWATYPRYANLGVMTTNAAVLASAALVLEPDIHAQSQFFRHALEKRAYAIGSFPDASATNHPTLGFAFPVLDHADRVFAVVFAELDLNWFHRFGSDLPAHLPKRSAFWTEVDRQGTVLAHYPKPQDWIGRSFGDTELLGTVFSRSNGVLQVSGKKGPPMVYAFDTHRSQLAQADVAVILATPQHILFADADSVLRRNLTWLAVAAALALAFGWMGGKLLILRPVRALVKSTLDLATAELPIRSSQPYLRDELAQLTLAFNRMAKALEQREQERQHASAKLQVLSQRLVEVQENERRHIARELHDEIGQSLTAAEMNLHAALQAPGADALEHRLAESIQAVERVLAQVHDLSLNLRPSMLDDLGLEPALRWYTHRQAALTGLRAEFRADPLEARLEPMIETECFRVAQEALTNVVRHSQARNVRLELSHRNGHLHLSVRDDGVGFDVAALRQEAVRGASLGLLSMEERTALAGGGLEFNSAPGEGTEVHAWFPLRWHKTMNQDPTDE